VRAAPADGDKLAELLRVYGKAKVAQAVVRGTTSPPAAPQ
jgi:hypothetical protein